MLYLNEGYEDDDDDDAGVETLDDALLDWAKHAPVISENEKK